MPLSPSRTQILLVEDSPSDVALVRAFLTTVGPRFHLECEAQLAAAMDRMQRGGVDLVLLDLNLPDCSGLDTFHQLKARAGSTPIVILSGHADEELALAAVSSGAQDYLQKNKLDADYLARSIRYAVERARRQSAEHELALAGLAQSRLFPKDAPKVPGLDLAGHCRSARWAGGDYFDFLALANGCMAVVIADVSGHGVGAALIMTEVRSILRTLALARETLDPGEMLSTANRMVVDDVAESYFAGLLLVILDPPRRRMRFASAGHPGFVFDASGELRRTLKSTHPPLGLAADSVYASSEEIPLEKGELLLLYTDGLTESIGTDRNQFGQQRLFDLVREHRNDTSHNIVQTILRAAQAFAPAAEPLDDMTALVAKVV